MIITLKKKTTEEFLKTLIINKHLKADFSFNALIYGISGAGKSSLALRIAEIFCGEDGKERRKNMQHVCDEHVIYTPQDFDNVLEHVFQDKCEIPVLIYMEAREVLDARRFMSQLNLHLTRIAQLARRCRNTCNLFCVQREKDIDIRTRAMINVGFEIRRYGLSNGSSTRAYAIPYSGKELVKEDRDIRRPDIFINHGGELERVTMMFWDIPEMFSYFYEMDASKKEELIFGDSKKRRDKELKKRIEAAEKKKDEDILTIECPACKHRHYYHGEPVCPVCGYRYPAAMTLIPGKPVPSVKGVCPKCGQIQDIKGKKCINPACDYQSPMLYISIDALK